VSGKKLDHFFHVWLFTPGKPSADVVPKVLRAPGRAAARPSPSVHR
jgi:hypothetical protein